MNAIQELRSDMEPPYMASLKVPPAGICLINLLEMRRVAEIGTRGV